MQASTSRLSSLWSSSASFFRSITSKICLTQVSSPEQYYNQDNDVHYCDYRVNDYNVKESHHAPDPHHCPDPNPSRSPPMLPQLSPPSPQPLNLGASLLYLSDFLPPSPQPIQTPKCHIWRIYTPSRHVPLKNYPKEFIRVPDGINHVLCTDYSFGEKKSLNYTKESQSLHEYIGCFDVESAYYCKDTSLQKWLNHHLGTYKELVSRTAPIVLYHSTIPKGLMDFM